MLKSIWWVGMVRLQTSRASVLNPNQSPGNKSAIAGFWSFLLYLFIEEMIDCK